MRIGVKFLTTTGWLQSNGTNRRSDVAFLKLDRPFDGEFTPFQYHDTPLAGSDSLGVVGYPADMYDEAKEHGARMYEMFAKVNWNLDNDGKNMLAYPISTTQGKSLAYIHWNRHANHHKVNLDLQSFEPQMARPLEPMFMAATSSILRALLAESMAMTSLHTHKHSLRPVNPSKRSWESTSTSLQ